MNPMAIKCLRGLSRLGKVGNLLLLPRWAHENIKPDGVRGLSGGAMLAGQVRDGVF